MHVRFMITLAALATGSVFAAVTVAPNGEEAPAEGPAAQAVAAMYVVDTVHSTALFRVHHFGAGQFWGRFNDLSGEILTGENSAPVTISVTIKTESIDTNNDRLDGHLKTPDFFSAREYPEMTFTSTSIEPAGEGIYTLTGDLTIRGVTKPVTAELEHTGTRGGKIGFEARFTVTRSEFGVNYGVENGALGNETKVIVGLEANAREG